jgi:hypothetical protein
MTGTSLAHGARGDAQITALPASGGGCCTAQAAAMVNERASGERKRVRISQRAHRRKVLKKITDLSKGVTTHH